MDSEVKAFENERLRKLSEKKNTTVLTVEHDFINDPWPEPRLRNVMEPLVARVLTFDDSVSDFTLRKTCMDDSEVLEFQRQHPKMYWMLTDRKIMSDERSRKAITGMLYVRKQVESGAVTEGHDADAMATKTVLAALQSEI
tara:strand:- start:1658 stop:2080 length:423 start_codon:yes stop_codon:yes gene_type:complete